MRSTNVAENGRKCDYILNFEVRYGKSTSTRSRDFAHALKLIRFLTQGRALFSQITLITFIVECPKLHSE